MPPICTPEKFNDTNRFRDLVTPPLPVHSNLKKNDTKYIKKIQEEFPTLSDIFSLHKKIGEGTFSTVFLASLHGDVHSSKQFAIKYLIPTTHPKRIEVELHCLKQIGGVDNVAGLELCLREQDNVAFIMPYLQHDHFGDYFKNMDAQEVALYIKNLLQALCRVHSFGIIHRDVKPNNFLYDRKNKKFLLIDFGLAQVCSSTETSKDSHKRKRETDENDVGAKVKEGPPAKRQALQSKNLNTLNSVLTHLQKYENSSSSCKENSEIEVVTPSVKEPLFKSPLKINAGFSVKKSPFKFPGLDLPYSHPNMLDKKSHERNLFGQSERSGGRVAHYCRCYGRARVCSLCVVRAAQEAPRAGTPGFRPPEVLLKHARQTTAVDLWAVGVVMLSLLARAYPFFHAPDDLAALAELITLFGDKQIKQLAHTFGRNLICSESKPALNLRKVCRVLRARGTGSTSWATMTSCVSCGCAALACSCPSSTGSDADDIFPPEAYDLLTRLLDVNPSTRITAQQALQHPFLT